MTTTAPPTLTAKTPEDVLAAVPLVLGFVPEESVVMLTTGAVHPFHARLDLPRTGRDRRAAAESLVGPAVRHRAGRVMFVMYTADASSARSSARVLVRAFVVAASTSPTCCAAMDRGGSPCRSTGRGRTGPARRTT